MPHKTVLVVDIGDIHMTRGKTPKYPFQGDQRELFV